MVIESISVYGYDQRLLHFPDPDNPTANKPVSVPEAGGRFSNENDSFYSKHEQEQNSYGPPPSRCHLLELPLELRQTILSHVLPRTIPTPKGIAWLRGTTSILATNHRLHHECAALIYSNNTFVIDTVYDCSTFAYQWLLPTSGLVPKRTMAFPEQLAARNICLLQRLHIRLHHVDSYTGMVKYNCGGHGLVEGLRDQVRFLCQVLRQLPEIKVLHVELLDSSGSKGLDEIVCGPFLELRNTRVMTTSGAFSAAFARKLEALVQTCLA